MSSMSTAACLQEALAQAGVGLGLKEALCSDSGQRETRKSGLSKDKWSVCDVLTLSELSRVEWNVLCRQSSYSEEGGHQEIGKKKHQVKESLREGGVVSKFLHASLSSP